MASKKLIQLLSALLPSDMPLHEIVGKKEAVSPVELEKMLHENCRLNWDAYIENNRDVKQAGIEPVKHFVHYGIYEGRRLFSWKTASPLLSVGTDRPAVSIIIPNYNNIDYLQCCLESLKSQTLENIEVIIVDDASSDGSIGLIKKYASIDPRFKLLAFKHNRGTHSARKAGVEAATGRYIMFIDADDYLNPDSCEIAFAAISRGYDIVGFNINCINSNEIPERLFRERVGWFNQLEPGLYTGYEKLHLAYKLGKMPHFMWNKIFEAGLLKMSFNEMSDGHYTLYEDQYEFLVPIYYSRNFYKLHDYLINYRFGLGITAAGGQNLKTDNYFIHSDILNPIEQFCIKHNLYDILDFEKEFLLRCTMDIFSKIPPPFMRQFIMTLVERFGRSFFIKMFTHNYPEKLPLVIKYCMTGD